jgi:hypothetical protein
MSIWGVLLLTASSASIANAQNPVTAADRFFGRIDLGVSAEGQFTPSSSGITYLPQMIYQTPSSTAGALIELRYIKSPLMGFNLTYSQARYTENFAVTDVTGTPAGQAPYNISIQSKVAEYSLGYVAHGPRIFGVKPFAGGGVGALEFKPTAGGGLGAPPEERVLFYYTVGVEDELFGSDHFGFRAQFRQSFFGAPDFNENYLATGARSISTQPSVGFYLRF